MSAEGTSGRPRESTSLRDLWRFLGFSLPYWPSLTGGLVTGLARMVLMLYVPWYTKHVIDEVAVPLARGTLPDAAAWADLGRVTAHLGAIMLMHWVATLGRFYFPHRAAASAIRDVRFGLFSHIQRLSLGFHTQRPSGALVARVIADVEAAQHGFDMILIQLSQALLRGAVIVVMLLRIDWQWALVALSTTPLFLITTRLLRRPMRRATRRQRETVERISGLVQERFSMIREVQAFTAEEHEGRRVLDEAEQLRRHTLKQVLLGGVLHAASEITRMLAGAVVLIFGVYRISQGQPVTAGELAFFVAYTAQLLEPVQFFTDLYTRLQVAGAAAERVFHFFDTEPVIRDSPGARPLRLEGPPAVAFDHVSFAYPTDKPAVVLQDVCLEVPGGSKVVLVGESGGGKSTLMSLLPRFYDVQKGRILLQGRDTRYATVQSLRQAIGIVAQEPVLFTGTIAENILYGRRNATDEALRQAARDANAESFILEFEKGYDTPLGERGVGLSGGQVQRIAIARAFLKNPPVLILDEPTSNLDATSEALVLSALDRLAAGRTTFIIAHRLSVARDADLIVVLDRGRIVETGTHEQLLRRGLAYAALWRKQVGLAEDFLGQGEPQA